jgi:REP element-mobilizing transposase RayT
VVFSTKKRAAMIKPDWQPRIHEYLGGIVRGERGVALQIGGMPDHVHLLIRWRTDESLASLMRVLKTNSSKWMHEKLAAMREFAWQEGYAAFTVSASQKDRVAQYIANQERHHGKRSLEEELVEMLRAHGVEYDPRYLWD